MGHLFQLSLESVLDTRIKFKIVLLEPESHDIHVKNVSLISPEPIQAVCWYEIVDLV